MYEKNIHIFSSGQWVKSIENHYWWSISKATSPKDNIDIAGRVVKYFKGVSIQLYNAKQNGWIQKIQPTKR